MDKGLGKGFNLVIDKIVEKRIKRMRIPRTRVAKVNSINSDSTINVTLPPSTEVVHNLKNISNETLSVNEDVFLLLVDGTMSNAVVWIKKG